MKALITGITGMVGSHLADFILKNTDWDVYGVCRWRSPLDNVSHLLSRVNKRDRVFFEYADLNDEMSLITAVNNIKPNYVFHLAAQSYPQTSFTAPIDTLNTNILGTCRLLEAFRLAMQEDTDYKPVIHVCASSEVFGRIPADKKPKTGIHEECSFHPASPYAISKTGTDLLGRYYAEAYGMTVMTTRMFTHTGPRRGDVFHESTFAKQIAMIEKKLIPPVVKVGNLKSLRTYADVRDAVRAYYMLVTVNPIPGEYYNIGGSYTCEVGDTLNTLISYSTMKDQIKIEVDPERLRPIDADLQVPDCRKFKKHSGWEPEIPFEKTMHDLLDYWRNKVCNGESFLTRSSVMLIQYIKPDFVFENEAGSLKQLVHDGWKQINVITSIAGAIRGKHYHKYNEEGFYIVDGSFKLLVWKGDENEEYIINKGDMFMIPPYVFHTFEYIEDTVLVSMYSNGVELSETEKDIWTE